MLHLVYEPFVLYYKKKLIIHSLSTDIDSCLENRCKKVLPLPTTELPFTGWYRGTFILRNNAKPQVLKCKVQMPNRSLMCQYMVIHTLTVATSKSRHFTVLWSNLNEQFLVVKLNWCTRFKI